MSTVGSKLDDQSSQIHIITERSEIRTAYAGFDTQSFQIDCGSHPFPAPGDEKIRHMFENVRDQQSAKTNQGTSASGLAEGSMESTALLNVDLYDGVHNRLQTKSSLIFNHRKGTTHRRASFSQHNACSNQSALPESTASDATRATML
jgi:hypothetical protein